MERAIYSTPRHNIFSVILKYILFYFLAQCKPGTYSPNGLETCESCPLGKYQPVFGSKFCVACPEVMSTVNRGAVGVSECGGKSELMKIP